MTIAKLCSVSAIETAVAELQAALPADAVIAVVVELPGHRDYRVANPSSQCPAATYGMLQGVVTQHVELLPRG